MYDKTKNNMILDGIDIDHYSSGICAIESVLIRGYTYKGCC